MIQRSFHAVALAFALLLSACGDEPAFGMGGRSTMSGPGAPPPVSGERWLSAWGGTRTGGTAPADATIRNIARVTAGGSQVRLRLFNLGSTPITIGSAWVGLRMGGSGAALAPGSNRQVTFDGQPGVTIPPGTPSLYSDAVAIDVRAQEDLAVSFHVPGSGNPAEFATEWNTSYLSAAGSGDVAAQEDGSAFTVTSDALYALRDVEVLTAEATGAITFLGSSSFHGSNSTRDAHLRVTDQIAARIAAEIPAGRRKTVVNRGIGGDTLESAFRTRMDDIWTTQGVDTVVVWVTNDLSTRSVDDVIADYLALIAQAHERGISVICPTWVPGAQSAAANFNGERDRLNQWILESGNCDAAVDYAAIVQNETLPFTWKPEYLSDHIHTNDEGHTAWAQATPIEEWLALRAD